MKRLWYLSFATKERFLGAVYLWAEDMKDAHEKVTQGGLNPGGEIAGAAIPPGREAQVVKSEYIGRLLSREELNQSDPLGRPALTNREMGKKAGEGFSGSVCQACNEGTCAEHHA